MRSSFPLPIIMIDNLMHFLMRECDFNRQRFFKKSKHIDIIILLKEEMFLLQRKISIEVTFTCYKKNNAK